MSLRSGLAAQLAISQEATFGTRVVPDHFYEIVNESMKLNRRRVEAAGIRPGKLVQRSQRFRTTQYDVTGDFEIEAQSNNMGILFYNMLGSKAQVADGAGFKRTYTLGDSIGESLTVQIGTPGVNANVMVREYNGCKIEQWDIMASLDKTVSIKCALDGVQENLAQTLAVPSWPSATTNEVFYADEVTFTIGGVTNKVKDFSLTGKNNYKTDRFFLGQQTKLEQLRHAYLDITGKMTVEFADYTLYNHYVNDDITGSIVLTCVGQKTYDTGKFNKLVITLPATRYDGDTPNVKGPDVIEQSLSFTALDDDTNQPITIDYYTGDSVD